METDLGVYEIAYLCAGPSRVALVTLVALHADDQITISSSRHHISLRNPDPRDPIEAAALAAIPPAGVVLGTLFRALTTARPVRELDQALAIKGIRVPGGFSLPFGRAAIGRRLRQMLIETRDPGHGQPGRIAVQGTRAIENPVLRRIFETPDPRPTQGLRPLLTGDGRPTNSNHT